MIFDGYRARVAGLDRGNLVAYYPLDEHTGTTAKDYSNFANDGTYEDVALANSDGADGRKVPYWDGVNCDVNIDVVTADITSLGSVTMMGFFKVYNAGVWTDSTARCLFDVRYNVDNRFEIQRTTTNGRLRFVYEGNNVQDYIDLNGLSTTDWFHVAITVDADSADEVEGFYNGGSIGTSSGLEPYSDTPNESMIGSRSYGNTEWYGYAAHVAVWNGILSADEILTLSRV